MNWKLTLNLNSHFVSNDFLYEYSKETVSSFNFSLYKLIDLRVLFKIASDLFILEGSIAFFQFHFDYFTFIFEF
jgi:hypothetical protein